MLLLNQLVLLMALLFGSPVLGLYRTSGQTAATALDEKGISATAIHHSFAHGKTRDPADTRKQEAIVIGDRDLAMVHVPYNFGHTIGQVAFMRADKDIKDMFLHIDRSSGSLIPRPLTWALVAEFAKPNAEVWGHFNPDLQVPNALTGCPMYLTPQKYWPELLARRYFGNRTVFGMLRDPYERLVSMFRGDFKSYGSMGDGYQKACDVNGAINSALKKHLQNGDVFASQCTFLPQAEYFDGPYGIKLPIDNRKFPRSMNRAFAEHNYTDMGIREENILHVTKCLDTWAGDLDPETKALVQRVYARDFELLCKHFGHCDPGESVCLEGVQGMCPPRALELRKKAAALSE